MTKLDSHAPSTTSRRALETIIYRDIPQARSLTAPARFSPSGASVLFQPDESTAKGIFLGFGAMTLLTILYSFTQLWSLLSGGSLEQAVRAIVR